MLARARPGPSRLGPGLLDSVWLGSLGSVQFELDRAQVGFAPFGSALPGWRGSARLDSAWLRSAWLGVLGWIVACGNFPSM